MILNILKDNAVMLPSQSTAVQVLLRCHMQMRRFFTAVTVGEHQNSKHDTKTTTSKTI